MRTTIFAVARRRPGFRASVTLLAVMAAFFLAAACSTSVTEQREIAVNAPATGVVRRVLVNEGAAVEKDAAIIEIAVQPENARAPQPSGTNSNLAVRATQTNLSSAEGEANRTAAELRRIEPLVKRGLASQAELDKARAQALDARERLDLAREKADSSKVNRDQPASTPAKEEIVTVRVPAAGIVRALSVHAGQQVAVGESMATLVSQT